VITYRSSTKMMNLSIGLLRHSRFGKIAPCRFQTRGLQQTTGKSEEKQEISVSTQGKIEKQPKETGSEVVYRRPKELWRRDDLFEDPWNPLMPSSFVSPYIGGFANIAGVLDRMNRTINQFPNLEKEFADLVPRTDVRENSNNYEITAEIPGVSKEDIHINLYTDTLTIKGTKTEEKTEEEGQSFRKERTYGSFLRQFTLPEDVNSKDIKAQYENGVLKLILPKKETTEKQEIKVE